ncbi:ATP-binding protein [Amycolatopsis thermophila]|uniref:Anti-sigma regulatory factor (Ser/Thr protein kinase) n=1 Tax=Amycolatopsis thermophila TaxID=206084 RepID=A0ABU0ENM6_9PSEU|nr:ATP-binding protein [Amycolatopsis thermophila]MDQ0376417.1 anti-sigma regulatory factor (Ser/Thr protein kinase) [Amycolatopsis thermophila]
MDSTSRPSGCTETSLHCHWPASPRDITELRYELVRWAHDLDLPGHLAHAIGLAGYEALTNSVTHAYPDGKGGPVELHASRDHDLIAVTVIDRGRWKPLPPGRTMADGRGFRLIRGLAGHVEITASDEGTTVSMTWQLPHRDGRARSIA